MSFWTGRTARTVAAAASVAVLASGCTDDGESESTSTPTRVGQAGTLDRAPAELKVTVAKVFGSARKAERKRFGRLAAKPVVRWLGHGYPGSVKVDRKGAFAPFTQGAARLARRQDGVMTLGGVSDQLSQVVPTLRRIRLHGFAHGGKVVGATAAVTWVLLSVDDEGSQSEIVVEGDLSLTKGKGNHWAILGFDVNRSEGAPGTYREAQRAEQRKDKAHDKKQGKKQRKNKRNGKGDDR